MHKDRLPRISAVAIEKIRPHEECDRSILNDVTISLHSDGVMRDPVLIDSRSYMILDGTHRYWALIRMGCRSIPVAYYDYLSDGVKIGCWNRCLDSCILYIPDRNLKVIPVSREEALSSVRERRAQLSVICKEFCHIFKSANFDIFKAYSLMSMFEKDLKSRGHMISYATESDSLARLDSHEIGSFLAPPSIKKEEATYAATTGRLFPIKSTRHVLPCRPLGIKVPVEWLKLDPEEADLKLQERVSKGSFRKIPNGALISGRRYEEEVYIYEPLNR